MSQQAHPLEGNDRTTPGKHVPTPAADIAVDPDELYREPVAFELLADCEKKAHDVFDSLAGLSALMSEFEALVSNARSKFMEVNKKTHKAESVILAFEETLSSTIEKLSHAKESAQDTDELETEYGELAEENDRLRDDIYLLKTDLERERERGLEFRQKVTNLIEKKD